MSDLIKIFIQQQRPAFDTAMPSGSSWTGLEKALDRLPTADELEAYLMQHRCLLDTEMPTASAWQGIEESLDKCKPGNELERFLCENRTDMDTEIPDLRVWSAVSSALPGNKKATLHWGRTLLRAAAAVALLVTGLGAGIWYARSSDASGMDMAEVSPEYAELEQYYERDISGKKEKLATFTGSHSADVMQDIEQLDKTMDELRRELASVPAGNRQQVVRAMIENYKSKTAILQRVLEHLEENQNRGKNSKSSNETKNM